MRTTKDRQRAIFRIRAFLEAERPEDVKDVLIQLRLFDEAENDRLRRGLRQIVEGNYPAACDAETWAQELLLDPFAVEWDDAEEDVTGPGTDG